jgi:hypothetical protein
MGIERRLAFVAVLGILAACAPQAAHRKPRLPGDDGGVPMGSITDAAAAAPAACGDAPLWQSSAAYKEGDRVTAGSPPHVYQCKPWPYAGWCAIAAYQPGEPDGPWADAWTDLGPCP